MSTKAAFIKRNGALYPMDDDGREIMAAMPEGKRVMVRIHAPRNINHHRLMFYLMRRVIDGGAWDGDEESLLHWLKTGTGLVDVRIGFDGTTGYVPRSIDFESMPQDRFARWYERAVYLISTRLLGSDDWQALRDEIAEAADGKMGERLREHDARYGEAA